MAVGFLFAIGLALALVGCAVDGGTGERGGIAPPPMAGSNAARLGLAPALRPFHDELESQGDWVLVEPQGWVFRPRVNTVAWRPYQNGHWEPSYVFGWVWESNDPFGWITDHYGFWFSDPFQGWVWQPYGAWAPSWVAWVQVGDFVGWAPLPPAGTPSYENIPGGLFTFVPARALATPSSATHASFVNSVPDDGQDVIAIERIASHHGVYWNAGPDLTEVLGMEAAERLRLDERDGRVRLNTPARSLVSEGPSLASDLLAQRSRLAWRVARRELTAARAARPTAEPGAGAPRDSARFKPRPPAPPPSDTTAKPAPGDSLRRLKRGGRFEVPRSGAGNH